MYVIEGLSLCKSVLNIGKRCKTLKMIPDIQETYRKNLKYLESIIGLEIKTAIQEQYFFEGELDKESLGTLKLEFTNEKEITFDCNQDAETLNILSGGFSDKGTLETDFDDNRYKWTPKDFLNNEKLLRIGKIHKCYIEWCESLHNKTQSGCKIDFISGDYLYIWTTESDNIFYGLNLKPTYHGNENLKIELQEVKQ